MKKMNSIAKKTSKFGTLTALALGAGASLANVRQHVYVSDNSTEGQDSIIAWTFDTKTKVSMQDFSGTLSTGSALTSATVRPIFGASIGKWLAPYFGLTPAISLDLSSSMPYLTSNACEYDPTNTNKVDGINNMIFTSKLSTTCSTSIDAGSGIIGITKARFDSKTGEIVEADIQFDDTSFKFTATGSNDITGTVKVVNLNDVVTHEFGHFLGLDHSNSRTATMLFAVADDLQTTKDDDMTGMISLYPPSNTTNLTGGLQGSVTTSGAAVFGSVVFVIDARTLNVNSADFTDVNGAFDFYTLKPGPQVIFAEKYQPFGTNVHEYYSGRDGKGKFGAYADTCFNPGCEFMTDTLAMSFFADVPAGAQAGGLAMKPVQITAGQIAKYANVLGSNDDTAMADVPGALLASDQSASEISFDAPRAALLSTTNLGLSTDGTPVGYDAYRFNVPSSESIRISTAALSLYSRLNLSLTLFAANSATDISSTSCTKTATNIALAKDTFLVCNNLAAGDYIVKVTGTTVSCALVPGNSKDCQNSGVGESASISRPLYMIAVADNSKVGTASASASAVTLASDSLAATTYKNLPGRNGRSKLVSTSDSKGGCCGTLRDVGANGPRGPKTMLLSLLLNPVMFFAVYWAIYLALRKRLALKSSRG